MRRHVLLLRLNSNLLVRVRFLGKTPAVGLSTPPCTSQILQRLMSGLLKAQIFFLMKCGPCGWEDRGGGGLDSHLVRTQQVLSKHVNKRRLGPP